MAYKVVRELTKRKAHDMKNNKKKIVYIDMDNVLVDFKTGIDKLEPSILLEYVDRLDEVPNIFSLMEMRFINNQKTEF